ncbi:hypothetical protein CP970_37615 [Streptomyces kanamyceticus]|uniref:Uncharacterized protein n=1 Tax=Streptomyces kanamyceticus TaxID=1967 RepID=A0A5J6GJ42_STRKN|nr:hypothetical protein CP970_37615 [Streptomyces kanamyceticus]
MRGHEVRQHAVLLALEGLVGLDGEAADLAAQVVGIEVGEDCGEFTHVHGLGAAAQAGFLVPLFGRHDQSAAHQLDDELLVGPRRAELTVPRQPGLTGLP